MIRQRQPVIGVIGGMGPEATVELMRRVIAATPADDDIDHIRMIVDNNPKIPSRLQALLGERAAGTGTGVATGAATAGDPGPVLAGMARGLETAGADVLVIPCNTAHHYLPVIREAVEIPVVDMVALSVERLAGLLACDANRRPSVGLAPVGLARAGLARIGLLASPAVRLTGLFERACAGAGLDILSPNAEHEAAVLTIIKAVKAARVDAPQRAAYRRAAATLVERGAQVLVVACTELSVLNAEDAAGLAGLGVARGGVPVLDTLDVLVDEILARCGVVRRR